MHADRVSVTANGPSTAGEGYILECSAGEPRTTFQWLGPPDGRTPVVSSRSRSIAIVSNSSTSQLQFRPLQQSHNGSYSCRTTTNDSAILSQPIEIRANGTSDLA